MKYYALEKTFGEKKEDYVYQERTGAYVILSNDEGKFAVVQTSTGYFLLGGGVEEDESHEACIVRECMEEAGLVVEVGSFICKGDKYHWSDTLKYYMHGVGYFYHGRVVEKRETKVELDHQLCWLSVDECQEKLFLEHQKWAVTQAIEDKEGKFLKQILTDSDFEDVPKYLFDRVIRHAARGVLLTEEGNVVMMYMGARGSYKLPGGGIERGERPIQAFRRELQEETGYECTDIHYIGEIEEHKRRTKFYQKSYCYIAKVSSQAGEIQLTANEEHLEMRPVEKPIDEVIRLMKEGLKVCTDYRMLFMLKRDLTIIEHAKAHYVHSLFDF